MVEFKTEEEMETAVVENFKNIFPFKFKERQKKILPTGGKNHCRIDLMGEDENNEYIIELKRDLPKPKDIYQVLYYIDIYKKETSKNIIGCLAAPVFNKTVYNIAKKYGITLVELKDYVCIANNRHCSKKYKKVNNLPDQRGGKRPGAGRPASNVKRQAITRNVTPEEKQAVDELLKNLRR